MWSGEVRGREVDIGRREGGEGPTVRDMSTVECGEGSEPVIGQPEEAVSWISTTNSDTGHTVG